VCRKLTYPESLYGPSKTPEDTEKSLQNMLAAPHMQGNDKVYRFSYAVHELIEATDQENHDDKGNSEQKSRFIGAITLRTLSSEECKTPPHDTHGSTATTLSLEMAYMYLPTSWGRGYATESVSAVLDACARSPAALWTPYEKVCVRAIVHEENIPSQNVMQKCGMDAPEVLDFEGGTFFIAGKWRTRHRLFVYGKEIVVGSKVDG
jgi:RimJ/RimL family protein N-acetyltransferase